ncbi:MAG: UDP-N-acetylmuramoyl-L-alanyl-D-glutamate--2,6-diaminopimelate ligase [Candidatus Omnitrophota bacterium]|nr:MAG: UDP-N-acetylmuramoyl-L-alanyl-D-glutamate--2,6-diaminopimelate ligase [Candidatus Omnitrophota bacterium]
MNVRELFSDHNLDKSLGQKTVKGICDDSRSLKDGELFFVRRRKNFDIFSVLAKVEQKALALVADAKDKIKVKKVVRKAAVIFVKDVEKEFHRVAERFYKWDKNNLQVIGVTGTNGKTTVTNLIYYFLKKLAKEASLVGTVNYCIAGKKKKGTHTTPDYLSLRKLIAEAEKARARYMVMEVSSHGAAQERIKGIEFSHCVFTNLSRDHLDYHKTMESYFNAKKSFFLNNKDAVFIINIDDPYGKKLAELNKNAITYGLRQGAKLCAKNIKLGRRQTTFDIVWKSKAWRVRSALVGEHNVSNVLAALATLFSLGFSPRDVIGHSSSFPSVEGRLEEVGADVFIDYAHTPDALEKVLLALKDIGYANTVCVFGCGGQRDKGKRLLMGAIADKYTTFSFITSDNPRNEDPLKICEQVKKGFKKNNYAVILKRKDAIKEALKLKPRLKNSCVLVAGKGHERYQTIKNKNIPFSDSKVIRAAMKS